MLYSTLRLVLKFPQNRINNNINSILNSQACFKPVKENTGLFKEDIILLMKHGVPPGSDTYYEIGFKLNIAADTGCRACSIKNINPSKVWSYPFY